jgi:hypothetical protein
VSREIEKTESLRTVKIRVAPMTPMIAFDSNILSYFLEANTAGYDPATDPDQKLAPERRDACRLYLYADICWLPVMVGETEGIPDTLKRSDHLRWPFYSSPRGPGELARSARH